MKGNIKTSSTSKIKKIIVTKKNCREKIERLLDLGLNPHSKGLSFSVIGLDFRANSSLAARIVRAIKALNTRMSASINIMG